MKKNQCSENMLSEDGYCELYGHPCSTSGCSAYQKVKPKDKKDE